MTLKITNFRYVSTITWIHIHCRAERAESLCYQIAPDVNVIHSPVSTLSTFVGERESDQMVNFMFTSTFSHQERESGRGGDNQRWQIESLATCVPRPLQVEVAFPIIGRPTVEARGLIVHCATNHLGELVV